MGAPLRTPHPAAPRGRPAPVAPHGEPARHRRLPLGFLDTLWRYRDLTWWLIRRDVTARYAGSRLGTAWVLVLALGQLAAYTVIFGAVFAPMWPTTTTGPLLRRALPFLAGLSVFAVFGDSTVRAASAIRRVPTLVRDMTFPLELLPAAQLGGSVFHACIGLVVVWGLHVIGGGRAATTAAAVPVVLATIVPLCLGVAWMVAAAGARTADVSIAVGLAVQVALLLTPVFYPLEAIAEPYRSVLRANPLVPVVTEVRRALFGEGWPDWQALVIPLALGLAAAWVGHAMFVRARATFADWP